MNEKTAALYRTWRRLADSLGPRGAENVTDANRRWARIARAKEKYEHALQAERAISKVRV